MALCIQGSQWREGNNEDGDQFPRKFHNKLLVSCRLTSVEPLGNAIELTIHSERKLERAAAAGVNAPPEFRQSAICLPLIKTTYPQSQYLFYTRNLTHVMFTSQGNIFAYG